MCALLLWVLYCNFLWVKWWVNIFECVNEHYRTNMIELNLYWSLNISLSSSQYCKTQSDEGSVIPCKACLIALSWFSIAQLYIVRCLWKDIYLCIRYKTNKKWPESSSWLRFTFAFILLADASTPKQQIAHILCLLMPWFAIFSNAIQWISRRNRPSFVYIPTCYHYY